MSGLEKPSHPSKLHRETENILLLSGDLATRSLAWRSRPTEIEFSFNNLCNLQCIMCGKADGEPNSRMDTEMGVRALDEILPFALHLTPSANSEPFLNDLDLIRDLCTRHDVTLFLFTNGMLCTEEKFLKIRDRVHRLWFSFDSHLPETYEEIRKGARFDKVVKNIERTLELAREDGTEITFHFVLMRLNLPQLPDYVRFVAGLGGSHIQVQELLPNSSRYEELKVENAFSEAQILSVLDQAKEAALAESVDLTLLLRPPFGSRISCRPAQISTKAPVAAMRELFMESALRIYPGFCNMSASYLKVTPQGDVFPCCRAPSVLKMGNIGEKPFETIWNDAPYREFRRRMFAREYPAVCKSCSVLTGNPYFAGMATC